jgi:hypothetical protein
MKETIENRYKKVWKRKERHEEKMNEEQVPEIANLK